ncbi:MAG: TetR/AcrR family transcriptional regulator [Candidatus Thermoplasmatota archaeon]|nr:TetR/AcrR family transcriptional regulator [Candidatus Thermoplasmatota archaeon]
MSRERLPSDERQGDILEAALKIIQEEGYTNLTIRKISGEIGVSEAAIYKHFNSKEEILNDLATWIFEKNQIDVDEEEKSDEFEVLKQIIREKFNILEENPYFTAVLFQDELFREYDSIKEKFDSHREKTEEALIDIVERGIEKGKFSNDVDPEVFAELYMGAIRMCVLKWRHDDFSYPLSDKADTIIENLFKILKEGEEG